MHFYAGHSPPNAEIPALDAGRYAVTYSKILALLSTRSRHTIYTRKNWLTGTGQPTTESRVIGIDTIKELKKHAKCAVDECKVAFPNYKICLPSHCDPMQPLKNWNHRTVQMRLIDFDLCHQLPRILSQCGCAWRRLKDTNRYNSVDWILFFQFPRDFNTKFSPPVKWWRVLKISISLFLA